jgi:hypothetical protein
MVCVLSAGMRDLVTLSVSAATTNQWQDGNRDSTGQQEATLSFWVNRLRSTANGSVSCCVRINKRLILRTTT